jgi:sRNA-binding carbon storage regulator CsrA
MIKGDDARHRGPRMSATEAPVDVEVLREEIRKTYTDVSTAP